MEDIRQIIRTLVLNASGSDTLTVPDPEAVRLRELFPLQSQLDVFIAKLRSTFARSSGEVPSVLERRLRAYWIRRRWAGKPGPAQVPTGLFWSTLTSW